jgi:hypothetical protein
MKNKFQMQKSKCQINFKSQNVKNHLNQIPDFV